MIRGHLAVILRNVCKNYTQNLSAIKIHNLGTGGYPDVRSVPRK